MPPHAETSADRGRNQHLFQDLLGLIQWHIVKSSPVMLLLSKLAFDLQSPWHRTAPLHLAAEESSTTQNGWNQSEQESGNRSDWKPFELGGSTFTAHGALVLVDKVRLSGAAGNEAAIVWFVNQ